MTIGNGIWDLCNAVLLALTPAERLAAAQKGGPSLAHKDYSVLILGLVLVALVVLMGWVSCRRGPWKTGAKRELFWDGAVQRGLDARERQILLAVVTRSRLRRHHEVFARVDAFDRGAAKLLAECTRDRTAAESDRLRQEVNSLREKIGFGAEAERVEPAAPSSHNIPVGASVEVMKKHETVMLPAVVVRSDDLEIAVELQAPAVGGAGQVWIVRYHHGELVWEFETTAISNENRRLALSHTGRVRVMEPESEKWVSIEAPAVVARFPFVQTTMSDLGGETSEPAETQWFELVRASVMKVSASSLVIRSLLRVRTGDRVLVMFAMASAEAADEETQRTHIVGHIGRVRQCRDADGDTVVTVDLLGLADSESAELVRLARTAGSHVVVNGV